MYCQRGRSPRLITFKIEALNGIGMGRSNNFKVLIRNTIKRLKMVYKYMLRQNLPDNPYISFTVYLCKQTESTAFDIT